MLILTTSVELFIEVGYFIKIGNFDVNFRTICEFITFLVSMIMLTKYPLKTTKSYKYGIGLLALLLVSILLLILIPSDFPVGTIEAPWEYIVVNEISMSHPQLSFFVVQQNFQMIFYVISIFAIYTSFREEDYFRFIKVFTRIITFFLFLGITEFILKYVFHFLAWGKLAEYLFGYSTSTVYIARLRGSGVELQGLTREASHYSYVLFICLVFLLTQNAVLEVKKSNKLIFAALILMMFSMAFSTILYLSAFVLIYLLYNWHSTQNNLSLFIKKRLFIFASIIFILILSAFSISSLSTDPENFFSRRIFSFFQEINIITSGFWQVDNTSLDWSNRVRLLSIYQTLKAFLHRPIQGYGLGTITCHGATAMMLAGTGLFGLYYWTRFNFHIRSILADKINLKYFRYVVLIFLFVNLFNSFGLRPFTEMPSFLFAISISLLFKKKIKNANYDNHAVV